MSNHPDSRDMEVRHEIVLGASDLSLIIGDYMFRRLQLPQDTPWDVQIDTKAVFNWTSTTKAKS